MGEKRQRALLECTGGACFGMCDDPQCYGGPPRHLVSVSGGKDSTAVYLLALEYGVRFRAVFADTGNEHEATYEYVARLHERTGGPKVETVRADFTVRLAQHRDYIIREWPKQGISAAIVERAADLNRPTGNPYLDLCILKGRFPSRMAQFCTEELKSFPIAFRVVREMREAMNGKPPLQWLGIRAAESQSRAKQPRFNRHESGSYVWRPIFRWSLDDVWAIHRRHGLARNPLYDMGFDRVGCFPCINCRKGELALIAQRFPEHVERIAEWERIVAEASKRGSATYFAPGKDTTDKDGAYSDIHGVVEWSQTARGGRQFDMFQPGSGCGTDLCEQAT